MVTTADTTIGVVKEITNVVIEGLVRCSKLWKCKLS